MMRLRLRVGRCGAVALLGVLSAGVPLAMTAADPPLKATMELGRRVFTETAQPSCTICHALKDAGAEGAIGPSLDELKPNAERVRLAVTGGVGVMPAYDGKLTADEIKAISAYVESATGAASGKVTGALK